jgi:pimeloyl-ACP methyl ester carboxylesterase
MDTHSRHAGRPAYFRGMVRPSRRTVTVGAVLAVVALLVPLWVGGLASASPSHQSHAGGPRPTIVLVHGDWADGSSWNGVVERLQRRGHTVVAPPNPLRGPTSDAAYLASFLQTIPGPIVLVAHSYGGFVITNAATGNANIKALVYIDAFIPDTGQTLADLAIGSCVDAATAFDAVPVPGGAVDLYLRREANPPYPGFSECFANGVDRNQAAMLAAVQRPAALDQFGEASGPPAWETIPSWSLIGTADRVITPAQQQAMSTNAGAHISTVNAGHLSLVTRPHAVTNIIETAVDATT